jgi:hypothetical protein
VTGIDPELTAFELTVNKNFQEWVFDKQAGALKFNAEQMAWLRSGFGLSSLSSKFFLVCLGLCLTTNDDMAITIKNRIPTTR